MSTIQTDAFGLARLDSRLSKQLFCLDGQNALTARATGYASEGVAPFRITKPRLHIELAHQWMRKTPSTAYNYAFEYWRGTGTKDTIAVPLIAVRSVSTMVRAEGLNIRAHIHSDNVPFSTEGLLLEVWVLSTDVSVQPVTRMAAEAQAPLDSNGDCNITLTHLHWDEVPSRFPETTLSYDSVIAHLAADILGGPPESLRTFRATSSSGSVGYYIGSDSRVRMAQALVESPEPRSWLYSPPMNHGGYAIGYGSPPQALARQDNLFGCFKVLLRVRGWPGVEAEINWDVLHP